MSPSNTDSLIRKRSERRIEVHLPVRVRGLDARGFSFEEDTASENLCRSGIAFRTRFDVAIGSNLEIRIPRIPAVAAVMRPSDADFHTQGRVAHVSEDSQSGERVVGVQFTGPRFQRMFRSESAA
jgi:hypothetical protein